MEWHEPALEESGEELSRAISFEDSEEGKVSWGPPPTHTHTHTRKDTEKVVKEEVGAG